MRSGAIARALAALLAVSGCATLEFGSGMQKVWIESQPEGATALILPDGLRVETPAEIAIERRQPRTIRIEKPGYCRETVYLDRIASASRDLPVPLGMGIGIWVDTTSGAAWTLRPDHLNVQLWPADTPDRECTATSSIPRRGPRPPAPEPL